MERLTTQRPAGLTREGIRKWALVFMTLGILGESLLQNRILGMNRLNGEQLLALMENDPNAMIFAGIAVALQVIETCAVPLFCLLLVDGFMHTSSFRNYFLRVLGIAFISEIPYNFAMSGSLLDMSTRNHVFAMVLGLLMMYLYKTYAGKTFVNMLIKLVVTIAAFIWAKMLAIDEGACCVLIIAGLWAMRVKPEFRNMMGCAVSIACSMFSVFYIASPMAFLIVHFGNDEKGEPNKLFNYLSYPVILLIVGLAGELLI